MDETAQERRRRRRREKLAQLGAYVLIVAIGAYGFATSTRDREAHRQITANVVCGVAQLIRDLVTPAPGRKLTDAQKAYVESTLRRLGVFEREQLDQLGKECPPKKETKP